MKYSRGFSTLIIILLIAVVGVAVSAYYFANQSKDETSNTPPTAPTQTQTVESQQPSPLNEQVSSQVTVEGMRQYTDADFKFAFWYPETWTVQEQKTSGGFAGGTISKRLMILNDKGTEVMEIANITYPTSKITFKLDQFDCTTTYFFASAWMEQKSGTQCTGSQEAHTYQGQQTASGLPILEAQYTSSGIKNIIPLESGSGTHFIAVYRYPDTAIGTALPLARTVTTLSAQNDSSLIQAITDERERFKSF